MTVRLRRAPPRGPSDVLIPTHNEIVAHWFVHLACDGWLAYIVYGHHAVMES